MTDSVKRVSPLITLLSHTDGRTHGLTERSLTYQPHLALCDAHAHVKGFRS